MNVHPETLDVVRRALAEDIGSGDVTSNICVSEEKRAAGRFIAREPMIICGLELLPLIYKERGGVEDLSLRNRDGDFVDTGAVVATVTGRARTLLECERVALNFLQRLSGVATLARAFVTEAGPGKCRVLDTRKTTPGLRRLEKMAAAAGGATNHRIGLFDAVLIKNNHIAAAGGVRSALENSRAANTGLPVEIEVRSLAELEEALDCGARHLLLDNVSPAQARQWIGIVNGRATIEISGGVSLQTVGEYARTGADFVSAGAITHSARAMDLSFRLELL